MQWDGMALVVNHNLELKEAWLIFFFLLHFLYISSITDLQVQRYIYAQF